MISEDAITLVKALIQEAGCDGIYYCVQNAETFRFTSEEYHKFVEPYDLKVLMPTVSVNIIYFIAAVGAVTKTELKYGKIIKQRQ